MLNVCTMKDTVRFTNLSVLTISAFNVSKCLTFLLDPCAYVLSCFHFSHTCELYVSFLKRSVLFFLLVNIYRHVLKPQTFTAFFAPTPFRLLRERLDMDRSGLKMSMSGLNMSGSGRK